MSIFEELTRYDLIEKIRPLFERGLYVRAPDGKISANQSFDINIPWAFIEPAPNRHCYLWHMVLFDRIRVLPAFCLECWKVVVRPRSVVELFGLYDLMAELGLPSKLGVEVRSRVNGLYGAYFYNDSMEDGLRCYKRIKAVVGERISPDCPVILKRGCTEMEHEHGPSNLWSEEMCDPEWERIVDEAMDVPNFSVRQPDFLIRHIKARWIRFAWEMGDGSATALNGGNPLYPKCVTYHQMEGGNGA